MSAGVPVNVVYRDPQVRYREVVGVLSVVDEQLTTVAVHPLVGGAAVEVTLPGPGWYVAYGTLPSGQRPSANFRVEAGERVVVVIDRREPRPQPEPSAANGWIAGWDYRVNGGFTPLARSAITADGGSVAGPSGRAVLAQLAVGDGPAFSAMLAGGLPMRMEYHDDAPSYQLIPADGRAATMLGFLHAGDLRSAACLTPRHLPPAGDELALVLGYQFARCRDERLDGWTAALVEAWPDSFDAHLLRGLALLRQPARIDAASDSLIEAARHGLPVLSAGLRMFDHGLRLLSQGRNRPDLDTLRRRLVPYLRSVFDTAVTGFWCPNPNSPALTAAAVTEPLHARVLQLAPAGGHRLSAILMPVPAAVPASLLGAVQRLGGQLLSGYTVKLAAAGSRGQHTTEALDLPPELEAVLGGAAMATATQASDAIHVVFANVSLAGPATQRFGVVIDADVYELRPLSAEELYVRISWPEADLPDRIDVVRYTIA